MSETARRWRQVGDADQWDLAEVAPLLDTLRLNWLGHAEISLEAGSPANKGLSLTFTDPYEWLAFTKTGNVPDSFAEYDRRMRETFDLAPRHWVKLHLIHGQTTGYSQYFVVDPRHTYPVTTLRQGLRRLGCQNVSRIEPAFAGALQRPDTLWAFIAKSDGVRVAPRISCRTDRSLFPALFSDLVRNELIAPETASSLLSRNESMSAGEFAYLSVDLDTGSAALDFEKVEHAPEECVSIWPSKASGPVYLKTRLGSADWRYTVYRPLRDLIEPVDERDLRQGAQTYYESEAQAIFETYGATYQAGQAEREQSLAERAGIRPGALVVDLGCGAGGPARELAESVPSARVMGVTISRRQAALAAVHTTGVPVQIVVGDYHRLPLRTEVADVVVFLESIGYADTFERVLREAFRILKPGGRLYLKDVFVSDGELSRTALFELAEFDRVYAQRTPKRGDVHEACVRVGFIETESTEWSKAGVTQGFHRVMFHGGQLTAFGERHYRGYSELPCGFWEITAKKADFTS